MTLYVAQWCGQKSTRASRKVRRARRRSVCRGPGGGVSNRSDTRHITCARAQPTGSSVRSSHIIRSPGLYWFAGEIVGAKARKARCSGGGRCLPGQVTETAPFFRCTGYAQRMHKACTRLARNGAAELIRPDSVSVLAHRATPQHSQAGPSAGRRSRHVCWGAQRGISLATAPVFWEATRLPESSDPPDNCQQNKALLPTGGGFRWTRRSHGGPVESTEGIHVRNPPCCLTCARPIAAPAQPRRRRRISASPWARGPPSRSSFVHQRLGERPRAIGRSERNCHLTSLRIVRRRSIARRSVRRASMKTARKMMPASTMGWR